MDALGEIGRVRAVSRVHATPALGPAGRGFANAALLLESASAPADLLVALKAIERRFGRRPGRRWGPRVLDLDIILWSRGVHSEPRLHIPHPEMRRRAFVLVPLQEIVPNWRDPLTGLAVRQLAHRLRRRRRG